MYAALSSPEMILNIDVHGPLSRIVHYGPMARRRRSCPSPPPFKLLDACGLTGHRWLYSAPATDLAYRVTV